VTTAKRTLLARFDGDTAPLSRATDRASRDFRKFDRAAEVSSGRAGAGLARFGRGVARFAGVLAAATAGAGALLVGLDRIGSDAQQMQTAVAKAATVFGDSFAKIEKAAADGALQIGLTTREFEIMAAGLGDFLVPMGFARDAAADLSLRFLDLAGALSVWSAGQLSASDVSELFQSAMAGEYDSLQRLGIQINAARVEAEAEAIQKASNKQLTDDMARALAIEKIAREDSTDALNFFNSAQGEAARKAEEQKAKLRELWQDIQEKLIPIYEKLWDWIARKVVPAVEDFVEWLDSPEGEEAMQKFADGVQGVIDVLKGAWEAARAVIRAVETMIGWLDKAGGKLDSFLDRAEKVPGRTGTAIGFIRDLADVLSQTSLPGPWAGISHKQHGGPVMAGQPYIVGEAGAELFVPDSSGHIIPNGAGGVTIENLNVQAWGGRFSLAQVMDELRFAGVT
jgi:hypothetical protein